MLHDGKTELLNMLRRFELDASQKQNAIELRVLIDRAMSGQGDLQLQMTPNAMRLLTFLLRKLADMVATRMYQHHAGGMLRGQADVRAQAALCAQAAPRTQALTRPVLP
jgi:hypothetical protein